jgi:hypothetical protein
MVAFSRNGAKTSQQCRKPEAHFENPSSYRAVGEGDEKNVCEKWGVGTKCTHGTNKKQREKDTHAWDKGWMRQRYFGLEICLKQSRVLHMIDFPSKQTGEWTDCIFFHALESLGGSYLNFGTFVGILPDHG